jgi:hypothetical protein
MPIRAELKKYYGVEWRRYRLVLIALARNRCAKCGREFPSSQLAAAHITHDPRSSEVRILCFADHARHDAGHAFAVRRRNRARQVGQAWLWADVEWAPFPAWMRPRRVLEMVKPKQGELWAA